MPRETLLTVEERAKTNALFEQGMSPTNISKRPTRTINVVKRYLCNLEEYAEHLRTIESTKVKSNDRCIPSREALKYCSLGSQLCST